MTEYSASGDTSRLLRTHEGMTSLGIDLADLGITNSSAIDPLRQDVPRLARQSFHAEAATIVQFLRADGDGNHNVLSGFRDPGSVLCSHGGA
jgi:hypothetical protein